MKFLFLFVLKLGYTVAYLISVIFQFLWSFRLSDVDFTSKTMNWNYEEYEGYYCKNIFDMWLGIYSQSDEVRLKWEQSRDDSY